MSIGPEGLFCVDLSVSEDLISYIVSNVRKRVSSKNVSEWFFLEVGALAIAWLHKIIEHFQSVGAESENDDFSSAVEKQGDERIKRIVETYEKFRGKDVVPDPVIAHKQLVISKLAEKPELCIYVAERIGKGKKGKSLLSVGIGSGVLEEVLLKHWELEIIGVDVNLALLMRAKTKRGLQNVICADTERLPIKDNLFDIVVFPECIGHMHMDFALSQAHRVLKRQGRIHILTYMPYPLPVLATQYRCDSLADLDVALTRNGFRDIRVLSIADDYYVHLTAIKSKVHRRSNPPSPNRKQGSSSPVEAAGQPTEEERRIILEVSQAAAKRFPATRYGWARDLGNPQSKFLTPQLLVVNKSKKIFLPLEVPGKRKGYDCSVSAFWIANELVKRGLLAYIAFGHNGFWQDDAVAVVEKYGILMSATPGMQPIQGLSGIEAGIGQAIELSFDDGSRVTLPDAQRIAAAQKRVIILEVGGFYPMRWSPLSEQENSALLMSAAIDFLLKTSGNRDNEIKFKLSFDRFLKNQLKLGIEVAISVPYHRFVQLHSRLQDAPINRVFEIISQIPNAEIMVGYEDLNVLKSWKEKGDLAKGLDILYHLILKCNPEWVKTDIIGQMLRGEGVYKYLSSPISTDAQKNRKGNLCHINSLLERTIAWWQLSAKLRGVALELIDASGQDITIVDETYIPAQRKSNLREILDHIIDNALKYSSRGAKVTVTLRKEDEVSIEVKDQGIGIASDELPKILQRTQRAPRAKAYFKEGLGLGYGLSKARDLLISTYEGSLTIESEGIKKGTVVTVRLPLNHTKSDNSSLQNESYGSSSPSNSKISSPITSDKEPDCHYKETIYEDEPKAQYYFIQICEFNLSLIELRSHRKNLEQQLEDLNRKSILSDEEKEKKEELYQALNQVILGLGKIFSEISGFIYYLETRVKYSLKITQGKNLRQEAREKLEQALALLERKNEPAANAVLVSAMELFAEELFALMNKRIQRERRRKRVGFNIKTQQFWVWVGKNRKYPVYPFASTIYRVYEPVHHDLLWEALGSIDEQEKTEVEELLWLRDSYEKLSGINRYLDAQISQLSAQAKEKGLQPRIPEGKAQEIQEDLVKINFNLGRSILAIKEVLRYSLTLAIALNCRAEFRAARSILGVALKFVTLRGKEVKNIIKNIQSGRLSQLREIMQARNQEMLGRVENILQALAEHQINFAYQKISGFIRAKRLAVCFQEPEFWKVKGLLGYSAQLLKKGEKERARSVLLSVKARIIEAKKLAEFMQEYRDMYVADNLLDNRIIEEEAFDWAFAGFLDREKIAKDSSQASICRTRFSRAAFISLNIDNPENKSERIRNPIFMAVTELMHLKESDFSRIKKSRAKNTLSLINNAKEQGKSDYFKLSAEEKQNLLEALAEDFALTDEGRKQLEKAASSPLLGAIKRIFKPSIIRIIRREIGRKELNVIELGVGESRFIPKFKKVLMDNGFLVDITGIENYPDLIRLARERDIPVKNIDIKDTVIKFGRKSQDIVVLDAPQDIYTCIRAANDLVKDDGMIIIRLYKTGNYFKDASKEIDEKQIIRFFFNKREIKILDYHPRKFPNGGQRKYPPIIIGAIEKRNKGIPNPSSPVEKKSHSPRERQQLKLYVY